MKKQHRIAVTITGAALAVCALSGCTAIAGVLGDGPGDAKRDEESGAVTEEATVNVFSLKLGDCTLEGDLEGQISEADVVPCAQPHDSEVYYEITMDDGEFSDEAVDAASNGCTAEAFTEFVGLAYDDSVLTVGTLVPTQDTWESLNDRIVQCLIQDPVGQVSGSLRGAAR